MAMPYLSRISSASISARGITGIAALARRLDLDVVARHRRGVHGDVRALDVGRLVADEHLGAELLEALDHLAAAGVGAGDPVAHVDQDLGDAAHADAADPHEMDLLIFLEHHELPACWEMLRRTPAENIVMRSAEPPNETKGSGRPFVGSAPVTTPMFTSVWVASMMVSPSAR